MHMIHELFHVQDWKDLYRLLSVVGWVWAAVFFAFLLIVVSYRKRKSGKCSR